VRLIVLRQSDIDQLKLDLICLSDVINDLDNTEFYGDRTEAVAEQSYRQILTLSKTIGGAGFMTELWDRITGRIRKRRHKKVARYE
jgi:hypothetical protein